MTTEHTNTFKPGPIRSIRAGQQPNDLPRFRKLTTIALEWVDEPFTVTTMEGSTYLIGENNEHWEGGYWVAWPDDGTDPYPIAPSFVRGNYEQVQP